MEAGSTVRASFYPLGTPLPGLPGWVWDWRVVWKVASEPVGVPVDWQEFPDTGQLPRGTPGTQASRSSALQGPGC